jgi:hypothetical protein
VQKPTRLTLAFALLWYARLAAAQTNLGELLDAGAKRLSADEFKQELVQRVLVGPTASGGTLEVMYAANGGVQGVGNPPIGASGLLAPVSGEWTIDDEGRVCTSMRIGGGGGAAGIAMLPPRCEFWLRSGEYYFLSVSDSDRRARVFRRTVKK